MCLTQRLLYQFLSVLDALQVLLLTLFRLVLLLQVRLDGFILSVEVAHVLQEKERVHANLQPEDTPQLWSDTHGHKIFHHIHVGQRVNLRHLAGVDIDFVQTR